MRPLTYYIIGGRFQPFHIGHLALIEHAAKVVNGPIVVGVVNPDPRHTWPGDGEEWIRFLPQDNPLNFWERYASIRLALSDTELQDRIEAIVPMPRPSVNLERANQFIPPRPRSFILCEKWGDEVERWKLDNYRRNGEQVRLLQGHDLPKEAQLAEGIFIRSLMALGNSLWESLVPPKTVSYLKQIGLAARIAEHVSVEDATGTIEAFVRTHNPPPDILSRLDIQYSPAKDVRSTLSGVRAKLAEAKVGAHGEVRLVVDRDEKAFIERMAQDAYKLNTLKVYPAFHEMPGGCYEMSLATQTLNALKQHIANL